MASHPVNLAIRFLLEMIALVVIGMWGYKQSDNTYMKWVLAIGLPVVLAIVWGVFAVPDDPSRSGETVVVTPGSVRLILELGFFSLATWAVYDLGYQRYALLFGGIVVVHYLASYERIAWLLRA